MGKRIWFHDGITIERIRALCTNTLIDHLGIELLELGDDFISGRMPVDRRTFRPFGILHGGAYVVLSETLASFGANAVVDSRTHQCSGLEINANHIRHSKSGFVTGISKPLHIGKTTQVWQTEMFRDDGKIASVSRVTMAVLPLSETHFQPLV